VASNTKKCYTDILKDLSDLNFFKSCQCKNFGCYGTINDGMGVKKIKLCDIIFQLYLRIIFSLNNFVKFEVKVLSFLGQMNVVNGGTIREHGSPEKYLMSIILKIFRIF